MPIAAMGCTAVKKQTIQSVFLYGKTTCSIQKTDTAGCFSILQRCFFQRVWWFRQGAFFAIVLTNKPLLPIIRKRNALVCERRKVKFCHRPAGTFSVHSGQNLFIEIKWRYSSEAGKVVVHGRNRTPARALALYGKSRHLENLVCLSHVACCRRQGNSIWRAARTTVCT